MFSTARLLALLLVPAFFGLPLAASATIVKARGVVSGVVTFSPVVAIPDDPPIGDLLEFRLFYAANATNGETQDYDGMDPILEADLVDGAAHLFFLEKSGELALFVVYKRPAEQVSADALLDSNAGDFTQADFIVKDAVLDDYAVVGGNLSTSHQIPLAGRTDGYVATLASRFDAPGDVLSFEFQTPAAAHPSDAPLTSIQVFGGVDGGGAPLWVEIDSGPFGTLAERVKFTLPPPVPAFAPAGLAALGLLLGLVALRKLA